MIQASSQAEQTIGSILGYSMFRRRLRGNSVRTRSRVRIGRRADKEVSMVGIGRGLLRQSRPRAVYRGPDAWTLPYLHWLTTV